MKLPSISRILSSKRLNEEAKNRYASAVAEVERMIGVMEPVILSLGNWWDHSGPACSVDDILPMLSQQGVDDMKQAARKALNGKLYAKRGEFWDEWRRRMEKGEI